VPPRYGSCWHRVSVAASPPSRSRPIPWCWHYLTPSFTTPSPRLVLHRSPRTPMCWRRWKLYMTYAQKWHRRERPSFMEYPLRRLWGPPNSRRYGSDGTRSATNGERPRAPCGPTWGQGHLFGMLGPRRPTRPRISGRAVVSDVSAPAVPDIFGEGRAVCPCGHLTLAVESLFSPSLTIQCPNCGGWLEVVPKL
jgi:hypothetical protein